MDRIAIASVGLGNYAAGAARLLEAEAARPDGLVRFAGVCEPDHGLHARRIAELRARGVPVHRELDALLAEDFAAIWLPLPIALHRPFTERALAAGRAVLCEKPAAGCVDDVDAMIAARNRAGRPVCIGFQDAYLPQIERLKRALAEGVIGAVRSASLVACWPRGDAYYARSGWAGRLRQGEAWVLDSPACNAVAHYIHLALFLLGGRDGGAADALVSAAAPLAVEAELYRARAIENYDTACLRVAVEPGVPFLVLLTHAASRLVEARIELRGERGLAVVVPESEYRVTGPGGEVLLSEPLPDGRATMVRRFARHVAGEPAEGGLATLETARTHVLVVNGASEAAAVADVPESAVVRAINAQGDSVRAIAGIEEVFGACAAAGRMLHESGLVPWSRPGGRRDLRGYRHFAGPALTPSPTPAARCGR
jgi:predicted dehydrogenase